MPHVQREGGGGGNKAFHLVLKTKRHNKQKNLKPKQHALRLSLRFSLPHDLGTFSLAFGSSSNSSFENLWLPETLAAKSHNLSLRAMRKPCPGCGQTCLLRRAFWSSLRFYLSEPRLEHSMEGGIGLNLAQLLGVHRLVSEPFVWILSHWAPADDCCWTARAVVLCMHPQPCQIGAIISSSTH